MDQKPRITLSVLVTREEYSEAAANEKRKQRRHTAPFITGAGAVLMILGIAGLFFGRSISLSASAAVCLILAGLFLACYDGLIASVLDRAAAAREFDEKEDLHFATTYLFSEDRVAVQNGRIQGELPLSVITRWSETPALFTLAAGRELHMSIPKRLLTPEQDKELRRILEAAAGGAKNG